MTAAEYRDAHQAWDAEVNEEIQALVDWVEAHPYSAARWRGDHVGTIGTQTHFGSDYRRTTVQVRNSRRRRNQYATVTGLDRLELKVGARYRPAREVLGLSTLQHSSQTRPEGNDHG